MTATPRGHELTATYILEQMDPNPQSREELLQMAQIRATLAVVGQLRISNLLQLASGCLHEATPGVPDFSDVYHQAINAVTAEVRVEIPATSTQGPDEYLYAQLLPDIMDALGLEVPDGPQ